MEFVIKAKDRAVVVVGGDGAAAAVVGVGQLTFVTQKGS